MCEGVFGANKILKVGEYIIQVFPQKICKFSLESGETLSRPKCCLLAPARSVGILSSPPK